MKKTVVIFLHTGYWLLYLLLLTILFLIIGLQIRKSAVPLSFLNILPLLMLAFLPNAVSFYSFYFPLFTRFLRPAKFTGLIAFGIIACLISTLSATGLALIFFGVNQPVLMDLTEFSQLFISFFLLAAIHGGIALIIRGFVAWFEEIKLKEELAQKNYETEIALVKSQLNPHFLFNTINNIDVLIAKDPAQASAYLNRLSDILRYLVYEAKSEKLSLATELSYLEKYLDLQRIRTSNPNYVKFTVDGEPKNLLIAPMIFFPFIENAFKHTEDNKKSNTIELEISIRENELKFECRNTYQKRSTRHRSFGGSGNELIRKRLELLYPEKYKLEINDDDGIYQVKLTIDATGQNS